MTVGEPKRLTTEARTARVSLAKAQAAAVESSKDRMRRAVDALVHAGRHYICGMPPDQMATVLGTTVGVFAAAAGGAEGAFASRVDEVARDVIDQAQEAG